VFVPEAVRKELLHLEAPKLARDWAADLPSWIEVASVEMVDDAALQGLGAGERAAIALAISLHADLVLIDERKGTLAALNQGLDVTGTIGVLDLAAAFARLKQTSFRYRQELLDDLLGRKLNEQ
jgi:uncharacterized protein